MGGGSAQPNPHYRLSPWDGLVTKLGEERLSYAQGCTNWRWEPLLEGDFSVESHASNDLSGPVVHHEQMQNAEAEWLAHIAQGQDRADVVLRTRAGQLCA